MTGAKRATLADVARLAGMSPASASMILNDRPNTRLSPEAADRVRAAAAELGYRPNVAARGLRTARTNTIGFISDDVSVTRFASGQIRGALRAAENAGHVLLVIETGDDPAREAKAIEAVLDRQVDGIIFAAVRAREIALPQIPPGTQVTLLNVTSTGITSSVRPAEFEGGRTAVAAIADAGHRDGIIMVGQNRSRDGDVWDSPNVEARVRGIYAEMADRGLEFMHEIPLEGWTADEAYESVSRYLKAGSRPRCILVLNDPMAFGVYQALSDAALRIPEDVSVVSFDNDEITTYLRPGLTTVGLPYEEMGEVAVTKLLAQDDSEVFVPMPLIRRGSLAAP
jgi:LacI family transcriptional regulator